MVAFGAIAGSVAVLIKGSQSGDSSKQHMGVVSSLAAHHLLEHQHCIHNQVFISCHHTWELASSSVYSIFSLFIACRRP